MLQKFSSYIDNEILVRGERMNISKEEKRLEAVARMKALGIFPETVEQFEAMGRVGISEPPFGAFYWAEGEDLERIRSFEEQHDALVYAVVRSFTVIGRMDAYLYVSDYAEEWDLDRDGLKGMEPLAYVYNHDMPDCSEFGCIGIELSTAAGLLRIW